MSIDDDIKKIEFRELEPTNDVRVTELIKCSKHLSRKDYIKMLIGVYAEEGVRHVIGGEKNTYEVIVDGIRIVGTPDIEKQNIIEVKAGKSFTTLAQGVLQASVYAYMSKKTTFLYVIGLAIIKVIPMSEDNIRKMLQSRTIPRSAECNTCVFKLTCENAYNYMFNWKDYVDDVKLIDHIHKTLKPITLDKLLRMISEDDE